MVKRRKGLIITLIIVAVIVVILAAVAIIFFTTDIFKTGQQAFMQAAVKNMETFTTLTNQNILSQEDFRNTHSYNSTGTINGTIIQNNSNQNITLTTTARKDANTGRYYADIALQNAGQDVLKYSYINSDDVYAIKCDDVLANYVGVRNSNLKEYARNAGVAEDVINNIPDKIDFEALRGAFNLSQEEIEQLQSTYINVIINSIPEENFQKAGKENITVNNVSCNANKYTLTLNGEEIKNLLISLLETAKNDEISMDILAKLQNALTTNVNTTMITNNIDNIITEIENNETIANTLLTMDVYSYNGNTIKTIIDVSTIGRLTIDTDKDTQTITMVVERYDNIGNINMTSQVTLSKGNYNDNVVYNIEILPNTLDIGQTMNIMLQLGNATENGYTNLYEISIQDGENSSANFQYNVETVAADTVEEIEELTDSNSIIFNNYPIEQLVPFITAYIQQNSYVISTNLLTTNTTTVNQ